MKNIKYYIITNWNPLSSRDLAKTCHYHTHTYLNNPMKRSYQFFPLPPQVYPVLGDRGKIGCEKQVFGEVFPRPQLFNFIIL